MGVAAGQVWWLYGPPSVGKSATAWQLFAEVLRGEPRGYVDVDQVGMCYPAPAGDPERYAVEVTSCRLRVDPAELERRLKRRHGHEEVARALGEADRWDCDDVAGLLVDASAGVPLEVARRVAAVVRSAPSTTVRPSPGPQPPSQPGALGGGGGRAVLVCGPTGLGKSTVGFALFNDLLADGRRVAYLDLQQLGFLADLPEGAPGGHEVVAGCVADLWEQYRAVGADDLVLSGRVEQAADVRRYRDALSATSLTVCLLRASPEALRDRILARTRGGGPTLAGDALLGLTADEAEVVLREALTQQVRLESANIADITLDTADESVESVARSARSAFDRLSGAAAAAPAPNAR